jgi:YfiH family protein
MSLPNVPVSFYWSDTPAGPVLRCRPLDSIAPHFFTTREVPLASDDDWRRIATLLDAAAAVTSNQVHGRNVVVIRQGTAVPLMRKDGDVLVSDHPGVAIAVRAADCVPLLMADANTGAVAAVHAGWRGTAAGAAKAALDALTSEFGSQVRDVSVAIGPSIGACCYEVGSELVDAFAAAGHPRHLVDRWFVLGDPGAARGDQAPGRGEQGSRTGRGAAIHTRAPGARQRARLRLDIAAANRDQLVLAGVPESNIHDCGLCTAMHLDVLTSFRAEREAAGRIAGVIRVSPLRPSPHSRAGRRRG